MVEEALTLESYGYRAIVAFPLGSKLNWKSGCKVAASCIIFDNWNM